MVYLFTEFESSLKTTKKYFCDVKDTKTTSYLFYTRCLNNELAVNRNSLK